MSLLVVGSVAFDSIETPTGAVENVLGGSAAHACSSSHRTAMVATPSRSGVTTGLTRHTGGSRSQRPCLKLITG